MSDPQLNSSPRRPAVEPIQTSGNVFRRGDERFFIKGVYYSPKEWISDDTSPHLQPRIDPLTDDFLSNLRQDIPIIRELGLNTVSVSHLDPKRSHEHAMKALSEAGLYVVVNILECLERLPASLQPLPNSDPPDLDSDTLYAYHLEALTLTFQLIDQLAAYPNVLAFVVDANYTGYPSNTKLAEIVRASVRDIRQFLRLRHHRRIPIGVSNAEIMMQRELALQYFTGGKVASVPVSTDSYADDDDGRVDFFAPQTWSWANRSSFHISGWKEMVRVLGEVPVPMFLHEFGTYIDTPRRWEEPACLFSKDMTGVFSGGIAYQFFEDGTGYGLVEVMARAMRKKKRRDFRALKQQMKLVNERTSRELHDGRVKDYEGWVGRYPDTHVEHSQWYATANLPSFRGDWERLTT